MPNADGGDSCDDRALRYNDGSHDARRDVCKRVSSGRTLRNANAHRKRVGQRSQAWIVDLGVELRILRQQPSAFRDVARGYLPARHSRRQPKSKIHSSIVA